MTLMAYTQSRLDENPELRGTLLYNMIINEAQKEFEVARRTAADYAEHVIVSMGLKERVKNVGKQVVYQDPGAVP